MLDENQRLRVSKFCKTLDFEEKEYLETVNKFPSPDAVITEWEKIANLVYSARANIEEVKGIDLEELTNLSEEVISSLKVASMTGGLIEDDDISELAEDLEIDVSLLVKMFNDASELIDL